MFKSQCHINLNFTACHVTNIHQKRLYHALWSGDVFGTLVGVINGCKGSQNCQTIEHLHRDVSQVSQLTEDCTINMTVLLLFVYLFVVFSQTQQQLIVEALEVLP